MILNAEQIARYHRDGYLVLKGVFSAQEIAGIQSAARKAHGVDDVSKSLFKIPGLEHFWSDRRLVGIAKQLLGEPVTFFCEAEYAHYVFAEGKDIEGRHLHHDAKGLPDHPFRRVHMPPAITYPTLRFGIYFQDTESLSGGLKVVPGSHMWDTSAFDETALSYVNVASMPGDLICFCHRLLHSPYALRPADEPNRALSPLQEVKGWVSAPESFLPTPVDRETIFIDFAGNDMLTDLLIKSRALNPLNLKAGLVHAFQHLGLEQVARDAGVTLRLDFAVIEATMAAGKHIRNNRIEEASQLLALLPAICRLSRETSPHHSLFRAPVADDDSSQAGLEIARQVDSQMNETRKFPVFGDSHMSAWKVATFRQQMMTGDAPV